MPIYVQRLFVKGVGVSATFKSDDTISGIEIEKRESYYLLFVIDESFCYGTAISCEQLTT